MNVAAWIALALGPGDFFFSMQCLLLGFQVSFVMLQTVLKQESQDQRSAELKRYADQLEQTAPLGICTSSQTSSRFMSIRCTYHVEKLLT